MSDFNEKDLYPIEYDSILHETDGAWLLEIDGDHIWFPKSQCDLDEEYIWCPEWLAEKKRLL